MTQGEKRRVSWPVTPPGSSRNPRDRRSAQWAWREGPVDPSGEHFELYFGSAKDPDWNAWPVVARVGPAVHGVFPVEFVVDRKSSSAAEMIDAVARDVAYYLVELGERDPWLYAQYHCGTTSNLYSDVHWSFFRKKAARGRVIKRGRRQQG